MSVTIIDREVENQLKSLLLAKDAGRQYDVGQLRKIVTEYGLSESDQTILLRDALAAKTAAAEAKTPKFSGKGTVFLTPETGEQFSIGLRATDRQRRHLCVSDYIRMDYPKPLPCLFSTRWYSAPGEDPRVLAWAGELLRAIHRREIVPGVDTVLFVGRVVDKPFVPNGGTFINIDVIANDLPVVQPAERDVLAAGEPDRRRLQGVVG